MAGVECPSALANGNRSFINEKSDGGVPAKGGNAPTSDAGDAGEAVLLLLVLALPVLSSRVGGEPVGYSVPRRGWATVEVGGDAVAADPKL